MTSYKVAAILAGMALLVSSLVACADGSDQPAPAAATAATATSVTAPPAFAPVMELVPEHLTVSLGAAGPEVAVDRKVPVVTGVAPEHGAAFSAGIDALFDAELATARELVVTNAAMAQRCGAEGNTACSTELRFTLTHAEVYQDYATSSYELGMNIFGGMPSTYVKSLTMNLRTGQPAEVADFMADPTPWVQTAGLTPRCLTDFTPHHQRAGQPDAFSPTAAGLVLSWQAGTFDAVACGTASVTIPWDAATPATATPAPAPPAAPTVPAPAAGVAGAQACAGAPTLPEGSDPRVCTAAVAGATEVAPGRYGATMIEAPSKNIWCALQADYLDCATISPYTRVNLRATGPATPSGGQDGPPDVTPVTLGYGEAVTFGAFACVSQEIGLSCWNTGTGHGLFLSRAQTLTW